MDRLTTKEIIGYQFVFPFAISILSMLLAFSLMRIIASTLGFDAQIFQCSVQVLSYLAFIYGYRHGRTAYQNLIYYNRCRVLSQSQIIKIYSALFALFAFVSYFFLRTIHPPLMSCVYAALMCGLFAFNVWMQEREFKKKSA